MKTELVELKTQDGVWLDGLWFTPDGEAHPSNVGICQVHGLGSHFYNRIKQPALALRISPNMAIFSLMLHWIGLRLRFCSQRFSVWSI
jgi:hypothetical protein